MKRISPILLLLILIQATTLLGQKVPKDVTEKAKNLTPPEGKALVYIIRPSIAAAAIKMKLDCDGEYIGSNGASRFVYTFVDPGEHEFLVHAPEKENTLTIDAEAGKTYYVEHRITMGIALARAKLILYTDEKKARKKLKSASLSKDSVLKP